MKISWKVDLNSDTDVSNQPLSWRNIYDYDYEDEDEDDVYEVVVEFVEICFANTGDSDVRNEMVIGIDMDGINEMGKLM